MDTELQIASSIFEIVVKYLIPVLAVNYFTDISSRFIPLDKKFQIMPIICVFFAGVVGILYGYIEEENFRDTVGHIFTILTISGILFISGAYKAIKNRLARIIKKDKENNL